MGTSLRKLGLAAALERYQGHFLASRNLAERTRAEYARDIAFLIRFLGEQTEVKTIAQVDEYHLEAYLAELDRRSCSGQAKAAQGLVDQFLLQLPTGSEAHPRGPVAGTATV